MDKSELLEKLRKLDEVTLLELLNISADEIVDTFLDKIYERIDYLYKDVEELEVGGHR